MKKLWQWIVNLFKTNRNPYKEIFRNHIAKEAKKISVKRCSKYYNPQGGKGYYKKAPVIHLTYQA